LTLPSKDGTKRNRFNGTVHLMSLILITDNRYRKIGTKMFTKALIIVSSIGFLCFASIFIPPFVLASITDSIVICLILSMVVSLLTNSQRLQRKMLLVYLTIGILVFAGISIGLHLFNGIYPFQKNFLLLTGVITIVNLITIKF
jgi:hypothetical protein